MRHIFKILSLFIFATGLIACTESVDFTNKTEAIASSDDPSNQSSEQPVEPTETFDTGSQSEPFVGQPPQLTIDRGALYTSQNQVSLQLEAEEVVGMYITNDPNCSENGSWQPYRKDSAWSLSQLNQEARVFAKVKYIDDSESACVSDSIIHDSIPPVINFLMAPSMTTFETEASFSFVIVDSGSGLDASSCQVDNNEMSQCSTTLSSQNLSLGAHELKVVAADRAGNIATTVFSWTIESRPACFPDHFQQPDYIITNKVDILFVADTSSSLDREREAVADGIELFINELPVGTDYTIAVLFGHGYSNHTGRLFQYRNEPVVLTSEMGTATVRQMLLNKLAQTPQDKKTDGGEAGLYSLHRLISDEKLSEAKSLGFFRDDAALSVVFISDENDICARFPEGVTPVVDRDNREIPAFNDLCVNPEVSAQTVYQELVSLQNGQPLLLTGILYDDVSSVPQDSENEVAYGLVDIIELNNGISSDLAQPDGIDEGLSAIGQLTTQILQLKTEFELEKEPMDPSQLMVKVDGLQVAFEFFAPKMVRLALEDAGRAQSRIVIDSCGNNAVESLATNGSTNTPSAP